MAQGKLRWFEAQGVALAGLVAIGLVGAVAGSGPWVAGLIGLPPVLGTVVGLVIGFLLARRLLQWVLGLVLAEDAEEAAHD